MTSIMITLTPEAQAVLDRLGRWPAQIPAAIARAMDAQNQLAVRQIRDVYLSQKGRETLGVVTNRLRSSIRASAAVVSGDTVTSTIGSNVEYLGVHEFGFDGEVTVPEHTRTPAARVKATGMGGKTVSLGVAGRLGMLTRRGQVRKGAGELTQGGEHKVRAHKRHMRFPARAPLQRGISDRFGEYGRAISEAVVSAATGGKP